MSLSSTKLSIASPSLKGIATCPSDSEALIVRRHGYELSRYINMFPLVLWREFTIFSQAIGGDMLQVGSTDDAATTSDRDVLSENLRELADLAALQSLRM